ncbi:MAG TPA: tetratricopeptide repeat protein [Verrucomicrobiae bacterium]|nr:tetratricopeptide repeat protein [Verrucomicrobiae bacterium]
MNRIRGLRPAILFPVLLALITLAGYSTLLRNGFVKIDDGFYILHNPHVTGGLTWANLGWAFRSGYQGNWHPLTWLSHMVDVQVFGLRPSGHHLTSLLFHTANVLLLWRLLQLLTRASWASFVVAGLFALHPLHVESVAWAAERKDVLCTFFFFLMLLAYSLYAQKQVQGSKPGREDKPTSTPNPEAASGASRLGPLCRGMSTPERLYGLTLGCFVLALMSKPMVVTAPFVLLLLDFWPLGRLKTAGDPLADSTSPAVSKQGNVLRLIREKIPFFLLAAGSSVLTLLVQESNRATYLELPLGTRVANAVASYWRYLGKMVWPKDLAVFYPLNPASVAHLGSMETVAGILGLLAVSALALACRRRAPWFLTGWFWYVGTLVPVIGLIQVGGQAFADRYTYIPSIGVFLCVVWGGAAWIQRHPRLQPVAAATSAAVLCTCAVLTFTQTSYWRSDFTLFEHALKSTSNNALAHYHVGIGYRDQKQNAKAMDQFRAAIQADPTFAPAYSDLGALLEDEGRSDEALGLYQQAVKATPWAEQVHNHLGSRFWAEGQQEKALAEYAAALRCNPDFADAHFNLGLALSSRGNLKEAASHFAAVCRIRPGDVEALACLAEALFKEGRLNQAAGCFRSLAELAPTNSEAPQNLGLILAEQGEFGPALAQFRRAVQLRPDWPDALNALAWVLATHPQLDPGNAPNAVTYAERACQLSGGKQSRFWSTLDVAYAGAGRFEDAVGAATRAKALAEAAGQTNAARAAEARIESYRKRKPFGP